MVDQSTAKAIYSHFHQNYSHTIQRESTALYNGTVSPTHVSLTAHFAYRSTNILVRLLSSGRYVTTYTDALQS